MRAPSAGIRLNKADAAVVKGMLLRGDRQSDIASFFGVNGGRIAEISTGDKFASVSALPKGQLPPAGPYIFGALRIKMRKRLEAISDHLSKSQASEAMQIVSDTLRKL